MTDRFNKTYSKYFHIISRAVTSSFQIIKRFLYLFCIADMQSLSLTVSSFLVVRVIRLAILKFRRTYLRSNSLLHLRSISLKLNEQQSITLLCYN